MSHARVHFVSLLLFSADGNFEVTFKSMVVLNYTGHAIWIPPSIFKSSCTMDVEFFPFDEQKCHMTFASWIYNKRQVRLDWYDIKAVNLNDYVFSGTWNVIECPAEIREAKVDGEDGEAREEIIFFLKLRRKPLFYTVNMIVPCVLICFLSACVFYLPADAGEKMTMCISIMLALVVFILLLSKILPPTAVNVPLVAKFLLFSFIMNIMSVLITVFIVNWNFRTPRTHRMSKLTRLVFLHFLPRVLCMVRPHDRAEARKKQEEKMANTGNNSAFHNHQHTDVNHALLSPPQSNLSGRSSPPALRHHPQCPRATTNHTTGNSTGRAGGAVLRHQASSSATSSSTSSNTVHVSPEVDRAIAAVRFVAAHLKNEDDYQEV